MWISLFPVIDQWHSWKRIRRYDSSYGPLSIQQVYLARILSPAAAGFIKQESYPYTLDYFGQCTGVRGCEDFKAHFTEAVSYSDCSPIIPGIRDPSESISNLGPNAEVEVDLGESTTCGGSSSRCRCRLQLSSGTDPPF